MKYKSNFFNLSRQYSSKNSAPTPPSEGYSTNQPTNDPHRQHVTY